MSNNLDDLIDVIRWDTWRSDYYTLNDAERDEIVLALRVLRVLRHKDVEKVEPGFKNPAIYVQVAPAGGTPTYYKLDEAERILGIGGGE